MLAGLFFARRPPNDLIFSHLLLPFLSVRDEGRTGRHFATRTTGVVRVGGARARGRGGGQRGREDDSTAAPRGARTLGEMAARLRQKGEAAAEYGEFKKS